METVQEHFVNGNDALKDATIMSRLQPLEYYKKWIETSSPRNTRPDGRIPLEYRPVTMISSPISTADGSSTITIGPTTAVVGIKWEVCEPVIGNDRGCIVPNVTFCAGSSPSMRPGPPTERAQAFSNQIIKLLDRFIDFDSLKVKTEKSLTWVLYIDVMVLNDAGNVFSAVWLGLISALRSVSLPSIRIDTSTGMVYYNNDDDNNTKIILKVLPLPLSFSYFCDLDLLLVDPDEMEESITSPAFINILLDATDNSICFSEGINIPMTKLLDLLSSPSSFAQLSSGYLDQVKQLIL